ncbi:MAG TPA: IclR family transcriptional regulator [Dongiaceae bacterium]|jgi:DNA-binding IclR family transcriptional regulator|nr:IclR family transcriptional regulator [Dongiaceae bacterium]
MEKTVAKGLKVIEALAHSDGARTLTDLANECGLSKSNMHRLLRTLEVCGYVRHDSAARSFSATLRPWDLGNRVFGRSALRTVAIPHLEELAALTKETTHLSVFDGEEVIYIGKVDSVHAVRTYVNIGDRAPAYCCATGKAMLAHMPEETVRHVSQDMKRFTKNTIVSPAKLRADLERTRAQGYSMTSGEWQAGVLGFAAAIKSGTGTVLGAIGVAGPKERMQESDLEQTIAAVKRAASRIEAELALAEGTPAQDDAAEGSAAGRSAPRRKRAEPAARRSRRPNAVSA